MPGESIFISYRRVDTEVIAGRIYDNLVSRFGEARVFLDVETVPIGVKFQDYLDEQVGRCDVMLVVIGKAWLTVTDPQGKRRLDNPKDFVRLEIEAALRRNIPVIPVMVDGLEVVAAEALPQSIRELAEWQNVLVDAGRFFKRDIALLLDGLEGLLRNSSKNRSTAPAIEVVYPAPALSPPAQLAYPTLTYEYVTVDATGQETARQRGRAEYYREGLGGGVTLEMVRIPGGTFMMGQTEAEKQVLIQQFDEEHYQKYYIRELPQHQVAVPEFWMGRYQVTQAQWRAVAALPKVEQELEPEPSYFKGDRRPVESAWPDAQEFCARLSRHTGKDYRLPSEAEWEYACRAGTKTAYNFGDTITAKLANYGGDPEVIYDRNVDGTTDVGRYPANAWGLYDMHGNVQEWCQDNWHENYDGAPTDGSAWVTDGQSSPIGRGGSWSFYPWACRSACRQSLSAVFGVLNNDVGFRVVCSPPRT